MKVWKTIPCDKSLAMQMAGALSLPQAVAEILLGLGFSEADAIGRFLNPRLSDLSDPFLLPGLEAAAQRLRQAIEKKESIVVYGDYDVDGIVATALLVEVLRRAGAKEVKPCLPNRHEEGYGLSVLALERCLAQGRPQLLVTVDCGTNSTEAVQRAQAAGVDVVITDHHECSGSPAPAAAVVNPKLGPEERLKDLAGVGVAFKLCHGLLKVCRNLGGETAAELDLREYLDLVAVGTVADIVPLTGENRILVRHGLERMNRAPAARWQPLLEVAGVRGALDTHHIAFGLGPRLNAAGRLSDADSALELLLTSDRARAREIALDLDGTNRERQKIESAMATEAMRAIDAYFQEREHFGLVIARDSWHVGVIGIVASRLVARYRRPVIVIAFNGTQATPGQDGIGRGSGRSIADYHLLKGLEQCRQYLLSCGGHALAAGLEIERGQLAAFQAAFNAAARRELEGRDLRVVQRINAWVTLSEIDERLYAAVEMLKPFGQNNPMPVLAVKGARIQGGKRRVGANHLRFTVGDGQTSREAIAFGMADVAIPDGLLDVAFTVKQNNFSGNATLELNVQAIRESE
ncbi:MAG: single-stranded-DNA-specific exonuclease RecJ [Lentisphaerae bacterium]|nr:single-stranded-DNA-specific exonuclease RecJ [Lentisphaerota bacterium]